jgi:hypothetical protein
MVIKQLGHEADHSSPSRAGLRVDRAIPPVLMVWCLIKRFYLHEIKKNIYISLTFVIYVAVTAFVNCNNYCNFLDHCYVT